LIRAFATEPRAVVAGLAAPESENIDPDEIGATDETWSVLAGAFPLSVFREWEATQPGGLGPTDIVTDAA
jgi:hypothetical protein